MIPANLNALGVALLALVPGFLATAAWARAKTWKGPSGDFRTVLQSLATSLVIQVVLSPLTILWLYPVRANLLAHPVRLIAWLAVTVLAVPLLGGSLVGRLTDSIFDPASSDVGRGRLRRLLSSMWPPTPAPAIWDWLFTSNPPDGCFLTVEFTDGKRVAGVFAKGSAALTSPEAHGIFLSREWSLDEKGDLVAEVPGTRGVMILGTANIKTIRVLEGDWDGQ